MKITLNWLKEKERLYEITELLKSFSEWLLENKKLDKNFEPSKEDLKEWAKDLLEREIAYDK